MPEDDQSTQQDEGQQDDEEQGQPDPRVTAQLRQLRAEAKGWRLKFEDAKAKATEFDKLQETTKSEAQRQAEALTAAQRERDEAVARALRLEIAHERHLPPGLARRFQGSTREEIEADADDLLKTLPAATATTRRVPDAGQRSNGAAPTSPSEMLRTLLQEGRR